MMAGRLAGFVFLILLAIPLFSGAQNVHYSTYDKFDYRNGDYSVVGITGGLLYTYRCDESGYYLDACDDSMNRIATVVLDFFPEKIYQTKFVSYADKIIVLYQALESNKVVQYAVLLDEKGRMRTKPVTLGNTKTGLFGATRTYYSSVVSDNKKLLFIYSTDVKGESFEVDGKWLDDNLTIVKHAHATFKADNPLQQGEACMGNDSTVYFPAYCVNGVEKYADQYWFLKLRPSDSRFEPVELPLNDKYAAGGYLKIDNINNCVYFGGFYADKKNGSFTGLIFSRYDNASRKLTNNRFLPFDADLRTASGARRPEKAFDNYLVKQIIIKNDGGFVMVSEIHYVATHSTYNPPMGFYSYYNPYSSSVVKEYHYNDIMALSYNAAGERQWASFIPKEQTSQEDGGLFSSYSFLNSGGTLAFMYNDFNNNHSRIQLSTIYADGRLNQHSFVPEGNDSPDWIPRAGKQVGGRVLVVPCIRKKQICFARVSF